MGLLVLHPASMIIHALIPHTGLPLGQILRESFAAHHLFMGAYFAALGILLGLAHASYARRLASLGRTVERLSFTQSVLQAYDRLFRGYDPAVDQPPDGATAVSVASASQRRLTGKSASPGLAMGAILVFDETEDFLAVFQKPVDPAHGPARFDRAVAQTAGQLRALREQAERKLAGDAASIFGAHLLMLEDDAFVGSIRRLIENGEPVPRAILAVTTQYMDRFSAHGNPYLREKIQDLKDIVIRIMHNLTTEEPPPINLSGRVVITRALFPSDLLKISSEDAQGIIVVQGGVTGHVSILARSLEMPLVIADSRDVLEQPEGATVLLDADSGEIWLNPSPDAVSAFEERRRLRRLGTEIPGDLRENVHTEDGTPVILMANVNLLSDLRALESPFCRGVGLYRTEFSFLDRGAFPSEEEQYAIYRKIVEGASGKPVTFRTMDLGGDKPFCHSGDSSETNPLLGMRSIRFLLRHRDLFARQLRAILRAAVNSQVRIMFPMIASLDEFLEARAMVTQCSGQLAQAGIPHAEDVPVGAMLEVPAVADIIDELACAADFLSLGTNDFIQYMLAVDRTSAEMSDFYLPHHPAVLRAIRRIADGAARADKPLSICGDMASDENYLRYFLGIGVREFSLEPARLHEARQTIARMEIRQARMFADELLKRGKVTETREWLDNGGVSATGVAEMSGGRLSGG